MECGTVLAWSVVLYWHGVWYCIGMECGSVLAWSVVLYWHGVWCCISIECSAVLVGNWCSTDLQLCVC